MSEDKSTPATDEVVSQESAPAADVQPSDVVDSTIPVETQTPSVETQLENIQANLPVEPIIEDTTTEPVQENSDVPLVTQINPADVPVDESELPEGVVVINGRKYQETKSEDGCTYLNLLS